jgi:Uma2 family endonuclease
MSSASIPPVTGPPTTDPPINGQPTWQIAELYPHQGDWDEEEYLFLTDRSNRLIEFTDGVVEFLPVPTIMHQMIQGLIYRLLFDYVSSRKLGLVTNAGTRVYVGTRKYRQPDVIYRSFKKFDNTQERYLSGAELVVEIVSDDDRSHQRDYEQKVNDYAAAQIPEYWIVDPQGEIISVLALDGDTYIKHMVGKPGDVVSSKLLEGFTVDVKRVFDEGKLPDTKPDNSQA